MNGRAFLFCARQIGAQHAREGRPAHRSCMGNRQPSFYHERLDSRSRSETPAEDARPRHFARMTVRQTMDLFPSFA